MKSIHNAFFTILIIYFGLQIAGLNCTEVTCRRDLLLGLYGVRCENYRWLTVERSSPHGRFGPAKDFCEPSDTQEEGAITT